MDGMERGRVIRFSDSAELQQKRDMKVALDSALRGLSVAIEGKSERSVPDEEAVRKLEQSRDDLRRYSREMMDESVKEEEMRRVENITSMAKAWLSSYLSDEQFVEIFGMDNVA